MNQLKWLGRMGNFGIATRTRKRVTGISILHAVAQHGVSGCHPEHGAISIMQNQQEEPATSIGTLAPEEEKPLDAPLELSTNPFIGSGAIII